MTDVIFIAPILLPAAAALLGTLAAVFGEAAGIADQPPAFGQEKHLESPRAKREAHCGVV